MPLREPVICPVSVATGRLGNASGRYEKRLSDLLGLYEDSAAFEAELNRDDRVVYEVTDYRPSADAGDMIFGVTRMSPGRIGREYFFTRGHIHARADRPEIYYGESGQGIMLLESPEGEVRALPIGPRDIVYVPPYWIHRSVNVGNDDLVMTFAYPADSGQDYGIIERSGGMRSRVVASADGWALADNAAYRLRAPAEIDALFARSR
ncbi:MAG TPA: glucose-6-phosphate isomerase [Acidisoma sp.]|uniref:glucose-6-phosphate isomerase n=1 Tax=Acidisoma sp. TaxID=1872115 RepID=UPI002B86B61A|nr:glucose-6-phosphate isomerase [Acidisoma sp.]HTI02982.1 glucose-6-phosphate isomerase [Acidisoma sp.]